MVIFTVPRPLVSMKPVMKTLYLASLFVAWNLKIKDCFKKLLFGVRSKIQAPLPFTHEQPSTERVLYSGTKETIILAMKSSKIWALIIV